MRRSRSFVEGRRGFSTLAKASGSEGSGSAKLSVSLGTISDVVTPLALVTFLVTTFKSLRATTVYSPEAVLALMSACCMSVDVETSTARPVASVTVAAMPSLSSLSDAAKPDALMTSSPLASVSSISSSTVEIEPSPNSIGSFEILETRADPMLLSNKATTLV